MLFIPAGSLKYWNAWLYIGSLITPMTIALVYLYTHDPSLLEKRINTSEKEKEQKSYVKLSLVWFIISFVLPGLDFRYGWSSVPLWLVLMSVVVMQFGYTLFILVMKQNSYASRVIEIQEKQKLIDTGLYAIVRHPLYLTASIIYISSPLILGSFYALIPIAFLPLMLAYRIINEEKILIDGLEGYKEYMKKVKYRLIPFVW
jgi:protein-S-isoprenylcysteine O-methyltransferase Ste14